MSVTTLLAISLGAILTNNFIFAQFLASAPSWACVKKIDTAIGMGAAVTFVMGLASAFCYLINMVLVSCIWSSCRPWPTFWSSPVWCSLWKCS